MFSFIKLYSFLVLFIVISTCVLEHLVTFLPVLEIQTCILSHFPYLVGRVTWLSKRFRENPLLTHSQTLPCLSCDEDSIAQCLC